MSSTPTIPAPLSVPAEDKLESSRILLIEDDSSYAYLCKRFLHADKQFAHVVIAAGSIAQGLAIASIDAFECLVVDYQLPDGQGTQLIDQLKVALGENMPPAIVLTADESRESAVDAVRSGAFDFLCKSDMSRASLCRSVGNAVRVRRLNISNQERVEELEVANQLLRQKNEEIQRFYHTVSHEVKTPLTAIQEFVAIVCDGLAGELLEEQRTILNYALESCDQIKNQFNDLLELSRFETGKMSVKLEPCSIYEVFDHCVVSATPEASEKRIVLKIVDQPKLPMVMMHRNRIIQVLSNLINNAIRFTDSGGEVTISSALSIDENHLRLSVRDTGCGIPVSDQKHVFDRLYQVTSGCDSVSTSGLGLGLSIASEIVRLHGSHIEIDSKVGHGSEFSFELAIASAASTRLVENKAA